VKRLTRLLDTYSYLRVWFGVTILEFGQKKLTLARCDYPGGGKAALAVILGQPSEVLLKRGMVQGDKYKPRPGDTLLYFENLHGLDNLIDNLKQLRPAFEAEDE
jgi:hypothetical protein